MSIRDATEPVSRLAPLNLLFAIESPPILSAPVRVGARISRIIQHAQRRPGGQRPEDDRVTDAKPRDRKALLSETLSPTGMPSRRAKTFRRSRQSFPGSVRRGRARR